MLSQLRTSKTIILVILSGIVLSWLSTEASQPIIRNIAQIGYEMSSVNIIYKI